ncbi:hypothetical protein IQ35_01723 [Sphingobium wenxiniae]|uniref:Uncharacterized protein n=2 Tax=Sphingobium wenxiniae (strain DSM 21828 / CGMCC 1.7748 / JZ-1) TaxID=595605 RepID=A0A562KGE6_SPHWJ|nr:hypothetical protein IQ35_01723 [Sphingobium wenxiniae]
MSPPMKRAHRKWLIVLVLLALGAVAWWAGLFTVGDCLMQGGRWNWSGHFCRLDSLARPF